MPGPAEVVVWGGKLPSTRRATVGGLAALGIALGGNLGGCASFLLGLDGGQLAGRLRLDVIVPVGGYRRCVDYQGGYELLYPARWLADQTLAQRAAARAEAARSLDPPALRAAAPPQRRRRSVAEPSAAFGPAGGSGEKNISVIVAPIFEGFSLQGLGAPQEAAQRFLTSTAAPPGSGKTAQLLAWGSSLDEGGVLYYSFEYTIQSPTFHRHNIAELATQGNLLYTLNAQCPQDQWAAEAEALRTSAASLHLLPLGGRQFPDRL